MMKEKIMPLLARFRLSPKFFLILFTIGCLAIWLSIVVFQVYGAFSLLLGVPIVFAAYHYKVEFSSTALLMYALTTLTSVFFAGGETKKLFILATASVLAISLVAGIFYLLRRHFENAVNKNKKIEDELRKSERRYRSLVENQKEGIGELDADYRLVFVNQATEKIFGTTRDKLLGRKVDTLITSIADTEQAMVILATLAEDKATTIDAEIIRLDNKQKVS